MYRTGPQEQGNVYVPHTFDRQLPPLNFGQPSSSHYFSRSTSSALGDACQPRSLSSTRHSSVETYTRPQAPVATSTTSSDSPPVSDVPPVVPSMNTNDSGSHTPFATFFHPGSADSTDFINKPMYFETGQFAGRTMRAELVEIQKADLGRKYARVDRRPLDPPPVVQYKLFEVQEDGIEREVPNYEAIDTPGLLCTVDLYPVPPPAKESLANASGTGSPGPSRSATDPHSRRGSISPHRQHALPPPSTSSYASSPSQSTSPVAATAIDPLLQVDPKPTDQVLWYINNFPIMKSSVSTTSLVGATVVQPNLVEYRGKKTLVFVFADLAVKNEGYFILRYSVFDIYGSPRGSPDGVRVMQAECFGGPFRVFSTKEFPGLQASTELTKHLARWGVRLNIRENERRRRKKRDMTPPDERSSPYTTTALNLKRKSRHPYDDEDEDDD
ncbi:hypothetical protein CC1G_06962 [Coprinopsis cinerea okayama7|uniref:Velvet domain-containing protein n=1 Tax=Coprinopsis cinerea (strain Okayama-7 / 130 / ATCC MYA-4618 / FGSC 9003) TaxID=240176 RepID=A8NZV1_COPC7|nr:hypothetical protein CC1G_06962 [Coprinopsis cinerea okayama7\|eukprot:XP_001837756.2 hypothetical protein CC1G_06962 [Coprinopsis cinerea okayama7\